VGGVHDRRQTAGRYLLSFNTATPDGGRSVTATFEKGGSLYATSSAVPVPDTNSWTTSPTLRQSRCNSRRAYR
jgi:hypothetical protein